MDKLDAATTKMIANLPEKTGKTLVLVVRVIGDARAHKRVELPLGTQRVVATRCAVEVPGVGRLAIYVDRNVP